MIRKVVEKLCAKKVCVDFLAPTKIEKIQDRRPGLKFASEIENCKRATQQNPIFVGNSEGQD